MTQMLCAMDLGCAEGRNESNTSSVGRNERGKEKKERKTEYSPIIVAIYLMT